jgi:hypothetical protein
LNHVREDVVPVLHLYGQDGQAHTELDSDRLGAGRKALELEEDLVSESMKLARGNLCREIIGYLNMDGLDQKP